MASATTQLSFHPAIGEVSRIVSEMAGIQLGAKQAFMVDSRLKSRITRLGLDGYESYLKYLRANMEKESLALLSLLTTHHTFFFREFPHFEFLLNKGLRRLCEMAAQRPDKTIRVWSAACSRGQEVYSLAMFLNYHVAQIDPQIKFEIWATDVDPESVAFARNGVYKTEELRQSPAMYLEGNWVRGKGNVADFSRVKDRLREACRFDTVNLLEMGSFLSDKSFDLIFCRNVFIYFDALQIQRTAREFARRLTPGGLLFLGVSESLTGLKVALEAVGPSVYQSTQKVETITSPKAEVLRSHDPIRRVLCVDDSPTIHALLGKILTPDNGFRIAAKAMNGQEALDILAKESFDAITLDLHMPQLDGLGFLKKYQGQAPVIILSSVNRDDQSLAQKAIALGALDYVEKPSLENLGQAGNEIRTKLRVALGTRTRSTGAVSAAVESKKKVKVLVVDDSAVIRTVLTALIEKDPDMEVVAAAERPSQVEALILKHKPDVITLDIQMPEMDGVELLKILFPKFHIPTVMISAISREEGPAVLNALEAGAVDYIQKPSADDIRYQSDAICDRIKTAARARVGLRVRSRRSTQIHAASETDVILLGASTGGTEALKVVLQSLPAEIPPVLIVQHMPPVFTAAFAQRLNTLVPFEVLEASDGQAVRKNTVYIAPGGRQMGLRRTDERLEIQICDDLAVNRHRPSVDYLFRSARECGVTGVAALLTGMGADGAQELKRLRDFGLRTVAQDEQTSVVYGMPREAVRLDAAEFVLPIDAIGEHLIQLVSGRMPRKKAK